MSRQISDSTTPTSYRELVGMMQKVVAGHEEQKQMLQRLEAEQKEQKQMLQELLANIRSIQNLQTGLTHATPEVVSSFIEPADSEEKLQATIDNLKVYNLHYYQAY